MRNFLFEPGLPDRVLNSYRRAIDSSFLRYWSINLGEVGRIAVKALTPECQADQTGRPMRRLPHLGRTGWKGQPTVS